ncbi:MAG: lamin tail domain-containing protein [bacterium]|nr:lamin tail domain-containing protein [bacterium]
MRLFCHVVGALVLSSPTFCQVLINEVDANTGGPTNEFVELYDGGVGLIRLDGLTLVFYDGADDRSYAAFSLDGLATDTSGYFVLGNGLSVQPAVPLPPNVLRDDQGAVALYADSASSFPGGTIVTDTNLVDAMVYGTNTPRDLGLISVLLVDAAQPQLDEDAYGNFAAHSSQRCTSGSGGARTTAGWMTAPASPQAGPSYLGLNYCAQALNSTGTVASMRALGSPLVTANDVRLICCDMPRNQPGYFLVNSTVGNVPVAPSNGNLCLALDSGLGRYGSLANLQNSGEGGSISLVIDLGTIPYASGAPHVVDPGDTFYFTAWFRDIDAGGQENNFADGLAITFL